MGGHQTWPPKENSPTRISSWPSLTLSHPSYLSFDNRHSGKYDYDFFDYLIKVFHKCKTYGFKCFIDPHQDVVRPNRLLLKEFQETRYYAFLPC